MMQSSSSRISPRSINPHIPFPLLLLPSLPSFYFHFACALTSFPLFSKTTFNSIAEAAVYYDIISCSYQNIIITYEFLKRIQIFSFLLKIVNIELFIWKWPSQWNINNQEEKESQCKKWLVLSARTWSVAFSDREPLVQPEPELN